jgi:hypothetical protein
LEVFDDRVDSISFEIVEAENYIKGISSRGSKYFELDAGDQVRYTNYLMLTLKCISKGDAYRIVNKLIDINRMKIESRKFAIESISELDDCKFVYMSSLNYQNRTYREYNGVLTNYLYNYLVESEDTVLKFGSDNLKIKLDK